MQRFLNNGRGALIALAVAGASMVAGCQGPTAETSQPTAVAPKSAVANRYWVAAHDTFPDDVSNAAAGRPHDAREVTATNAVAGAGQLSSVHAAAPLPSNLADATAGANAQPANLQPEDKVNHLHVQASPLSAAEATAQPVSSLRPQRGLASDRAAAVERTSTPGSTGQLRTSNSPADAQRLQLPQ